MSLQISLTSFVAYGLSYATLTAFCQRYGKAFPLQERLIGPICILPEWHLSATEKSELEQLPGVTRYAHCFCISYDQRNDEESMNQLFGSHWSVCLDEDSEADQPWGFAYVAPPVVDFLIHRELP